VSLLTSQGAVLVWGDALIEPTSISVSVSGSEVDITSMYSRVARDLENTGRTFVLRDVDVFSREAEIACDFIATSPGLRANLVGYKRRLTISFSLGESGLVLVGQGQGFEFSELAILTKLNFAASVGDNVRGSATFLVTGL